MKTLFWSTILLLSLMMISCEENKTGPYPQFPINEKSYIQSFVEFDGFFTIPFDGIKIDKTNHVINRDIIRFSEPTIHEIADGIGILLDIACREITWNKYDENKDYYYELTEKIGDTAYNSNMMYGLDYNKIFAVVDTLQSIYITCDKDFDENHPAGSSLNDLFSVYFEDPYAIIKNGYKSITGSNYYSLDGIPEEFPYALYGNKVSEINLLDKPYIGKEWYFVLESAPENTDEYLFSVSVANIQGKTIENTARETMKIKGSKN